MSDDANRPRAGFLTIRWSGLVSLVVGVGSGLLIDYFSDRRPKLTYDITTQEVFAGAQSSIGIFAIRVSNDGNQEIEQLLSQIRFMEGEVKEWRLTGIPGSARSVNTTKDTIEIAIPYLNPREQFSIQILLSGVSQPLTTPSIEIRGKGVIGTETQPQEETEGLKFFSLSIVALATLLSAFAMYARTRMRRIKDIALEFTEVSHTHSGDQRDTLAFVLETNGLREEGRTIREWPRSITYWAASDMLCHQWLEEDNKDRIRLAIGALEFLIGYADMAEESKRIVLSNMARFAIALGNRELTLKYVRAALETADPVVQKRIMADPELAQLAADRG